MRGTNPHGYVLIPFFGYAELMARCFGTFVVAICLIACSGGTQSPQTQSVTNDDACASGKAAYRQERDVLIKQLEAKGCQDDSECAVMYESNACVSGCGVMMPASGIEAATARLTEVAKPHCSACPPAIVPPCVPPGTPRCEQGRCVEAH